jgi:2-dehydro-3-deoxygluconokinase
MTRVIAIGECMVELSVAGEGLLRRRFAGDAYNTAVYLKRARPGVEVSFLTVTGDDPLSGEMRAAWAAEGVRDDLAFVDPKRRPALYLIETEEGGDRRFHYWRSESAARGWFTALQAAGGAAVLAGADLVYVSGISLAILPPDQRPEAMALLAAMPEDTRLAFDPNLRPALWGSLDEARACVEAMAGIADIVLPSRQDLDALFDDASDPARIERLASLGAREIAMTAEADDCLVWDGVQMRALTPPKAKAVDTSGGGDSFNGAYLAARLTGASPEQAAMEGLELAARVVQQPGALIPKD